MSILDYVMSGITLRDGQRDILLWLEANWDRYQVFVIEAPTSAGKSIISMVIARWQKSLGRQTALLTPSNVLINQYINEFKDIPFLKGSEHYMCDHHPKMTCADVEETYAKKCKDCKYRKARKDCIEDDISIYNYHSYYMLKQDGAYVRKDTLVIDEMHHLYEFLQDLSTMKFWSHKVDTTGITDIPSFAKVLKQELHEADYKIERHSGTKVEKAKLINKRHKLIRMTEDLEYAPDNFSLARNMELYKGKMMECVSVKPLSMKGAIPKLWNGRTDKIVMMSGTINQTELELTGINSMKVGYIKIPSPIPPDRRTVYVSPVASMSYSNQQDGIEDVFKAILSISSLHPNEKGVIHTSYSLSVKIASLLRLEHKEESRFMVYNTKTKVEVLKEFMDSNQPKVLIAGGLSDGVDLKGDLCRFQILTKIVYPSLADKHNKNMSIKFPELYKWMAVKTIVQACGRSTRSPDDHSITYIIDSDFVKLYSFNKQLFPEYFRQSVKFLTIN